jgi:hypothetical protein
MGLLAKHFLPKISSSAPVCVCGENPVRVFLARIQVVTGAGLIPRLFGIRAGFGAALMSS